MTTAMNPAMVAEADQSRRRLYPVWASWVVWAVLMGLPASLER